MEGNGHLPQPSPLPPDPESSLELVNAKLTHTIITLEYVKTRVDSFDDRIEELRTMSRQLQKTSVHLGSVAVLFASVKNPVSWKARIVTMGVSAFLGGLVAQALFIWLPKLIG